MLRQRVITAVLLLAVFLPALFAADPVFFVLCTLALMGAAAWEWGRLSAQSHSVSLGAAVLMAVAGLGVWNMQLDPASLAWVWRVAALVWLLLALFALYKGVSYWGTLRPSLRFWCGWAMLLVSWLALVQSRVVGINFLLSVMCLVWVSDISAYFAGRAWGNRWIARKLAVTISPGKTWEGVGGALLGVGVVALAWRYADSQSLGISQSIFSRAAQEWGASGALLLGLLVAAGVVGDLLESLFKRAAGVKDSSGLLPGHGGVLDRVDALLPVLPLAMCLVAQ
ncbi:MAG: phosphatidate cytidylyltransferase [Betaproteobacteria bacterium]|nr:phosphatidate cytidylyltransferase [Betaproteobacteria bacterium]